MYSRISRITEPYIEKGLSKAVEKIGQKGPNSVRNLQDLNYKKINSYVSDADNYDRLSNNIDTTSKFNKSYNFGGKRKTRRRKTRRRKTRRRK